MIVNILKNPMFGMVVSLMLGIAIVMVVSPVCRGISCIVVKAPPLHEVKDTVYQIGTKCYKFDTVGMDCPASGIIEAFENQTR
jgi:hypothetical protein